MLALVTAACAIDVDTDLPLIRAEMPEAVIVVWDDPSIDWSRFGAVVVRSTWDSHRRRPDFLAWARRVESVTTLWNPVEVLEWNTDKRYLSDLAARGIPTVPTWFVPPGEPLGDEIDPEDDLVIKPSIGADSDGVRRVRRDATAVGDHVSGLHGRGLTAMVQPYLPEIDARGETGLVYLAGEFSHGFRRNAKLDPAAEHREAGRVDEASPRVAAASERRLGDRVMAILPPTAYARVDLLPTAEGPVVLEVELTEPSLFLECDDGSAARAASVFRSLAR